MKFSLGCYLRRILYSSYHPYMVIPKPSVWPRRERVRRLTAWQYGERRNTYKAALRQLHKVFHYMTMQRQDEFKLEKFYAQQRVNTALVEHDFEYKYFRTMLNQAHILLDNIVLAQMAIYEPQSFKSLVMLTKQMAMESDIPLVISPDQAGVQTDESLFQEPLPKARLYSKGPAENYKKKPHPLEPSEF